MISSAILEPRSTSTPPSHSGISILCRQCRSQLVADIAACFADDDWVECETCGAPHSIVDGIWRMISAERLEHFHKFVQNYEFIRNAEGRGSQNASYYLALPFEDLSRRNSQQWLIRARTYRHLLTHIVQPMAEAQKRRLNILDLGSGNGWLSYRLSLLGHHPVAVDILVNPQDGLAAANHYRPKQQTLFPRVQAEADDLPFASQSFDLVIFNASFHYSTNYEMTLQEALRCISSTGAVVIADSPWYPNQASGEAMIEEKCADFLAKYGFQSNAIQHLEYLTPGRLKALSERCSVQWTMSTPSHGIRWALRPVVASLRGRRTPSQFHVHVARAQS